MLPGVLLMALIGRPDLCSLGEQNLNFACSLLLIMPTFYELIRQYSRWPMLGYESLRPVSRSAFLKENAAAIGLQVAEMWLMMAVMLLIEIAVLAPAVLGTANPWRMLAGPPLSAAILRILRDQPVSHSEHFFVDCIGFALRVCVSAGIVFADVVVSIRFAGNLIFVLMLVNEHIDIVGSVSVLLRVDLD